MPVKDISEQGRATQGVKLIKLDEGDEIAAITRLNDRAGEENGNGSGGNFNSPEATDEATGSSGRTE
jgi:DNA gyrase subunit A